MSDHTINNNLIQLRCGTSIFPSQIIAFEKELASLLERIPAKFILLVDVSGQPVTVVGDHGFVDTTALGSLIAADLAASQEIARMTGEFQDFQMILREGEKSHIIISEAGKFLTFLVQFSKEVPIGWARKLIQGSAQNLMQIMDSQPTAPEIVDNSLSQQDLPDLFNDALDEIWKG
ncbi:MAG TPA: roadblock/LC7 domain-containing protein [Anaerolineaceae bacterium]|nr:roadblock/LC7 domain-containing protein [Anaerolineaceae bacterium]